MPRLTCEWFGAGRGAPAVTAVSQHLRRVESPDRNPSTFPIENVKLRQTITPGCLFGRVRSGLLLLSGPKSSELLVCKALWLNSDVPGWSSSCKSLSSYGMGHWHSRDSSFRAMIVTTFLYVPG